MKQAIVRDIGKPDTTNCHNKHLDYPKVALVLRRVLQCSGQVSGILYRVKDTVISFS